MMNSQPTKKPDSPRGPFKGLRGWISRLLASKRFLLLLSFAAAILTWSALVASDGTLGVAVWNRSDKEDTVTYTNVATGKQVSVTLEKDAVCFVEL